MKNLDRLIQAPWPMHPRSLARLALMLQEDGFSDMEEPEPTEPESLGPVAVLPLTGIVLQHPGLFDAWPAVYTEWWGEVFDALLADDEVRGIVVPIDSPGGISYGVAELSNKIFQARGTKPVVAVANSMAASAAYWIGTAFERLLVTPGGEVGSVGVWTMHVDMSAALKEMGLDVTLVSAGEFKVEGNSFEPLSDEARAEMQRGVDEVYEAFVEDVARNRGVTTDTVLSDFGQGRMFSAPRAVSAGMADGVASLEDAIRDMGARVGGETEDEGERSAPAIRITNGTGANTSSIVWTSINTDNVTLTESRAALPEGAETRIAKNVEVRAEGEGARRLVGLGVPFRSLSQDLGGFREEFVEGPANIDSPELCVIWQHNPEKVFGRVGAGTARFRVDEKGVHYEADPPNTEWARGAMESVRRGDVHRSSFAFRVHEGGDRFERRDGVVIRTVRGWDLIEAGPQTRAAYLESSVVGARRLRAFIRREARQKAEQMRERSRLTRPTIPTGD